MAQARIKGLGMARGAVVERFINGGELRRNVSQSSSAACSVRAHRPPADSCARSRLTTTSVPSRPPLLQRCQLHAYAPVL
jgi:hypothetical protein